MGEVGPRLERLDLAGPHIDPGDQPVDETGQFRLAEETLPPGRQRSLGEDPQDQHGVIQMGEQHFQHPLGAVDVNARTVLQQQPQFGDLVAVRSFEPDLQRRQSAAREMGQIEAGHQVGEALLAQGFVPGGRPDKIRLVAHDAGRRLAEAISDGDGRDFILLQMHQQVGFTLAGGAPEARQDVRRKGHR